ncbi:MAG TPA: hypothetical protein PKM73_20135 [Verrucomicrobiota bacterium]|nr:hypothetical protein [Verrucomicrobiota bacterium]HNU51519.1 hypothetical protein [Verrucomicrobiota bacterium]
MKRSTSPLLVGVLLLVRLTAADGARAAVFDELYGFPHGPADPDAALVRGPDGAFYGTTVQGGRLDHGTIFRVTTNGILTTLAEFAGTNGAGPHAAVTFTGDGTIYGTTERGGAEGAWGLGTVFKLSTNGALTALASFDGTNGAAPLGALVFGPDGALYGTTSGGGDHHEGTVFRVTTGGTLTNLASFAGTNGASPQAGLTLASNGVFYGTTQRGGSDDLGTVFSVTPDGKLTTLLSFSGTNGARPVASLTLDEESGLLYGTTEFGGAGFVSWPALPGAGVVFEVSTNGQLRLLASFTGTNGAGPRTSITLGSDGSLYGTTVATELFPWPALPETWSPNGPGTLFRVTKSGDLTNLPSFTSANGQFPKAALTEGLDGRFYGVSGGSSTRMGYSGEYGTWDHYRHTCGQGQVFRFTLGGGIEAVVSMDYTNGTHSVAGLTLGPDGAFYGTTEQGGSNGVGTAFRIMTDGTFTNLASFSGTNGANPKADLLLGPDNAFYGTTENGGSNGLGTVFRLKTNGELKSLASFAGTNGANPLAPLALGPDGDFYGTTLNGGSSNLGTIFRVGTDGHPTSLVSFVGTNGAHPYGGLTLASNGWFYGTTSLKGPSYQGTLFRVDRDGVLETLVAFNGTDGLDPRAGLTVGPDGALYGTTSGGGAAGYGTFFRLTTNGVFTPLASFNCAGGAGLPRTRLTLGFDGAFYAVSGGTVEQDIWSDETGSWTSRVISCGAGQVYRVTTNGIITTLWSFNGDDGAEPRGTLAFSPDGALYGTASEGGSTGVGNVFRLSAWSFFSDVRTAGSEIVVQVTGQPGVTFTFQSASAVTGPWQKRTNPTLPITDQGLGVGVTEFSEALESGSPRFYRTVFPAY